MKNIITYKHFIFCFYSQNYKGKIKCKKSSLFNIQFMQPDPQQNSNNRRPNYNHPSSHPQKANQQKSTRSSRVTNQINQYRSPLPEVPQGQSENFFKEVSHRPQQQFDYITIGYNVGRIPLQLDDLFCIIVNTIHCQVQQNLKVIIDGDQLWVTATLIDVSEGSSSHQHNNTSYNMQQAHLNQSLTLTRDILATLLKQLIQEDFCKRNDKQTLEKVEKQICKLIKKAFSNPDLDD